MSPAQKSARKDAALNRSRLLDAASALMAERGLAVSLKDVADAAGLGVGTVYRHLPDKAALVTAVIEPVFERMRVELAAAAAQPDEQAFLGYLQALCEILTGNRLVADLFFGDETTEADLVGRLESLDREQRDLLRRAQASGAVRPDLELGDVILVLAAVLGVERAFAHVHPGAWRRAYTLLIQAITQSPVATPLAPAAPTLEQVAEAPAVRRRPGPRP